MEKTQPYYDFCIPYNEDEKVLRAIIKELIALNYKTIAIEQLFDHSKKNTSRRGSDLFPPPHDLSHLQAAFKDQIRILQRLTIIYVDISITHAMAISPNLKRYNLVAGQPKNDTALTHCCTTFNGDIITFDTNAGAKLLVHHKAFSLAVRRGIYFEIKYALAIRDSSNRKYMIKIAHNYRVRGKTKNVILSSGALHEFELRGPYDVANLAYIFGLSQDQGKNAIDKSCRLLFMHAESRRLGKTVMFVKSLGPVVFSDSSTHSSTDDDMETEATTDSRKVDAIDGGGDDSDDESKEDMIEQPNKKKRVC